MAGTKEIKRRIKSVKNTKKITKAMELVAASKMKRAVSSTLASRLYAEYSWEILNSVAKNIEEHPNPLFMGREIKNILLVLITSNRGLCGAYNAQVIKKTLALFKNLDRNINLEVITVGKKGDVAMRKLGKKVLATFTDIDNSITLSDITPISQMILEEFQNMKYDQVLVAYTDYVSALTQRPNIKQVLPISKNILREVIDELTPENLHDVGESTESKINYLVEGEIENLIKALAEKITRMQIYQMFLESNASEQSSRMMAMKNASEASGEMIDELTLMFNKARQSNITREISEISAGMASVQ